jgi:integrase
VFPTSVGTVHRPENLRRALMPLAQGVVSWLGFHALRHGFASALIEDGRNIVQISRLLGHHSPSFTLATYAHLMDDGVGGPLELDLTPSRNVLDAAVEHVLPQEEPQ